MSYEQTGFAARGKNAGRSDNSLENVFAHMNVDRAERIVEHVDFRARIECARQRDSLLVTTAQIYALNQK